MNLSMNQRKHSRIPALFLGLALLLTACGRENAAATMHLVKTEGMVRVGNAEGKNVEISENLGLYSGYEVNTLAESYGWITLDDTKLAKMDASSEVEIRKKDKLLELYVRSGGLFFNVTEPLAGDETMNIRTSTMAVGIRGTCGWVEVEDESLMYVYLLEGKVECSVFGRDGSVLASETITAGQVAKLVLDGDEASIVTAEFDAGKLPAFVEDALENPEDWGLPGSAEGWDILGGAEDSEESWADEIPGDGSGTAGNENSEIIEGIHIREEGDTLYFYGTGIVHSEDYEGYTPVNVVVEEGITGIGDSAFQNCDSLVSVTLPTSLESIGYYAFAYSSLASITLPDGLKSIEYGTFAGCSSLTSVVLPDGLESIGEGAFFGSGLTSVTLPEGLESIETQAFANCDDLTSVALPEGLESIGDRAFYVCGGLTSVTLPDSLKSIGDYAFHGCYNLISVTWPSNLESIGDYAFQSCSLTSIDLPDGLKSIGDAAFWGCNTPTSVTLPASIESIGEDVFNASASYLTVVKAPGSLQDTAASWFYGYESCANLFEWY